MPPRTSRSLDKTAVAVIRRRLRRLHHVSPMPRRCVRNIFVARFHTKNISGEDACVFYFVRSLQRHLALVFSRRFRKKSFCVETFLGSAGRSILLFARLFRFQVGKPWKPEERDLLGLHSEGFVLCARSRSGDRDS